LSNGDSVEEVRFGVFDAGGLSPIGVEKKSDRTWRHADRRTAIALMLI
jgi:hypothetical protein